ncbi:MAG: lysostaphin resistance A-like protein [Chloroflexota bacterium]
MNAPAARYQRQQHDHTREHAAGGTIYTPWTQDAVPSRNAVALAFGLATAIVIAEYLARRVLAPGLPILGAPVVNDMWVSALIYGILLTLVTPPAQRSTATLGRALRGVLVAATSWLPWIGAVLFLGLVVAITPFEVQLWGGFRLPSFAVPPASTVLLAGAAGPLSIGSLLLVNGLVIPLAEERLWRGLIQPRLVVAWGMLPGLFVTAVLFSLKHVILDASLGRFVALTAGGLVLGAVAYRASRVGRPGSGWKTSAVTHIAGNLVATSLALLAGTM